MADLIAPVVTIAVIALFVGHGCSISAASGKDVPIRSSTRAGRAICSRCRAISTTLRRRCAAQLYFDPDE